MSNISQFGGGAIKSIQRGVISITGSSTSATATITAVNTGKTELRLLGCSGASSAIEQTLSDIVLTNSTTITATRGGGAGTSARVSWELTEYY